MVVAKWLDLVDRVQCEIINGWLYFSVARRGAHLAAERSPSGARADGARRSVAVPNGEGVASGSATQNLQRLLNIDYQPRLLLAFGILLFQELGNYAAIATVLFNLV